MRRITALTICLLTSVLFIGAKAFACSCPIQSEEEARSHGDLIFIGTVLRVEEPGYTYEASRYTFAVKEIQKGSGGTEITVTTTVACPTSFKLGSTYLVSAFNSSNQEYYTNACSKNKWLSDESGIILFARENPNYLILGVVGIVMVLAAGLMIWLSEGKRAT